MEAHKVIKHNGFRFESTEPAVSVYMIFHGKHTVTNFTCHMSQNLQKWEKSETFLICTCHFLRFKKFPIENDTRYNFRIFNNLQSKRGRKDSKN